MTTQLPRQIKRFAKTTALYLAPYVLAAIGAFWLGWEMRPRLGTIDYPPVCMEHNAGMVWPPDERYAAGNHYRCHCGWDAGAVCNWKYFGAVR